ncbi:hypothetical protein AB0B89_35795 [Sphaerisporangium sp. NPDC049002]|uniref:hypothetical protein n=1 Tax=Sphaerisporangium sp. NPDC049002 TaxID=3155392 RepID=UPI0034018A35
MVSTQHTAPKCLQCRVNDAEWDGEPGAEGYTDQCGPCFWLNAVLAPHVHVERWWPAYLAAHPEVDPNHTWQTAYVTRGCSSGACWSRAGAPGARSPCPSRPAGGRG